MKLCRVFSVLLFLLISSGLFAVPGGSTASGFWIPESGEADVDSLISKMSDEQLLAQLLLFGYMGGSPSGEILDWIRDKEIGGVKIFGWNVKDLPTLADSIAEMQKAAAVTSFGIPLFIATDQEGGWVRHVRGETSETAGNLSLGASRRPSDAYNTGYYIGMELRALGINMNFAPTVDVYSNPEAHVIGPRAFSDDPKLTSVLASAYFKGMDKAGVVCTAKHFPGHGDADKDSHGALPVIQADMSTLWDRDLLPYRYLIKEGIPGIMVGHLAFPKITGDNTPASISSVIMTDVLREKMGYDELIVTDDLMMNGVQLLSMTTAEICKASIMAGVDIVLVSRTFEIQKKVWNYLSSELKKDEAFLERVRESAERIMRIKLEYLSGDQAVPLYPDSAELNTLIPAENSSEFFLDQALRSVTLIREEGPGGIRPEGRTLLAGQLDRFFHEGKKVFPNAETFDFNYSPFYSSSSSVRKKLKSMADDYDTIVFCLANPNSEQVLKELKNTKAKVIVLSVLTPIYLKEMDWVKNAVAVYGTSRESLMAGFAALSGRISPSGILPLDFAGDD